MADCIFCKIVRKELPSAVVYEDEHTLAIMDAGHVNPGHTLVLVKPHHAVLQELPEDLAAHAFRVAHRMALAIEKAYQPAGLTVLQANRPAGWQTMPHFHLHVLPRHDNDGAAITWPAKRPAADVLQANAERVKAALR
jgi:histidine triad (HIT) family protein